MRSLHVAELSYLFRKILSVIVFLLVSLLISSQSGEELLRSTTASRQDFSTWLLLESERDEAKWLDISAATPGVSTYTGGVLPVNTQYKPRMYTFKTGFRLPPDSVNKSLALYIGLFEYPFRVYVNRQELLKKGRYTDGYYNSSLRLSSQVFLPPNLLKPDDVNELVIEIYPAFETWALDRIWLDTQDRVASAVFWRSFLGVNLLQAAVVLSFAICLYFLVLNYAISGDTKRYLYFALFCFLFCLTYLNVTIYHESINELFFEALSKAGMIVLTASLLLFVRSFTGVWSKARFLWPGLFGLSFAAAGLVFLQADKESLLSAFSLALNLLILPQLLLIFVLMLVYKKTTEGQYFWPLFIALLILLACVLHDAYYFLSMTLPYVWLTTYGFFSLVVGIFVILVSEQARIYRTTVLQASALLQKQEQIEGLNQELTLQKNSFFRFVPTEFLQLLGKDSAVDIQLGDNSLRHLSVMFSDIRRFTGLCESMQPDQNFEFLNEYLNLMEKAIYRNHGFIDKYIGDAIMALFDDGSDTHTLLSNKPGGVSGSSSDVCLQAALEMERALNEFNVKLQIRNLDPVSIGIGVNTGPAVLGTVGSSKRLDTTVVGDSVNIASRLESLTKMYRVTTLVSEHTFKSLAQAERFSLRPVDVVILAGRTTPMHLYELLDPESSDAQKRLESIPEFEQGINLYRSRDFSRAEKVFAGLGNFNPADTVAALYRERCRILQINPPGDNWDGIFRPHK